MESFLKIIWTKMNFLVNFEFKNVAYLLNIEENLLINWHSLSLDTLSCSSQAKFFTVGYV